MQENEIIREDYLLRINKVLNYIQDNIEIKFSLSELSAIGNFSQFHFHRIITAYLGQSLCAYIKRIRIEKAAQLLLFSNNSVTEISIDVGYETVSSFSDAFRKNFGVSPSAYRKKHNEINHIDKMKITTKINFDFEPEIKTIPAKKIAFVRVFSYYEEELIGKAWDTLFKFASKNNLFSEKTQIIGISYDNPDVSKNNKYQYNTCISIDKDIKAEGEVGVKEIQKGKYAVFTYKGKYDKLPLIYDLIFKEWLLKSDYELRETEIFDRYVNSPFNSDDKDYITEIHIPIK